MPLPEELQGSSWTRQTARNMLPLLVWCAKNGVPITYGQLDIELQRRQLGHHVNVVVYGHPAGAIGDALLATEQEIGERIPPLNSLVINAKTGIPGSGCDYYLKHYLAETVLDKPTAEQRKAMALDTMEEVWRYQGWDELLERYGMRPIQGNIPSLTRAPRKNNAPSKGGWSNEPESEEHRLLKEWVALNPKILKSKIPFREGKQELLYASADKVDVMFEHDEGCIAVEVKSIRSNNQDLERGIYQCVKYQALLRAELKARGQIPNGTSVLVTENELPQNLIELADLFGIRVIVAVRTRA
ncbi:MAG: hypothetical protein NTY50_00545 [Methylobacter sp.]|nr:hypothetical protein [Methylobacter sp.]